MLKPKFTAALVLSTMLPVLAQSQEAPPPPGPYQAMRMPLPAMPGIPEAPQITEIPEASAPTATQIWERPAMMQIPYWMQGPAPAIRQQDRRQGSISPDVAPDTRGGGQAPTTQLSPAGQPTAPTISAPGYGVQVTPGFFPGYTARQSGAAQVQIGGVSGATARTQADNRGRYGYGYGFGAQLPYQGNPAYSGYPAYQNYPPYPGQMQIPYWGVPNWGVPMAPAYPYPGQVNR